MGSWGPGLYADDTTCDVRDRYVQLRKTGRTSEQAGRDILKSFGTLTRMREVECLVVFALADTQWRHGQPVAGLRNRALKLLMDGGDVAVWQRDAPDQARSRQRVLDRLRSNLESTPPAAKPVEVTPPKAHSKRVRLTAKRGTLFLLPAGKCSYLPLMLVGYHELEKSIEPLFCAFAVEVPDISAKLPTSALRQPMILETGLGGTTVFGGMALDQRQNPFAQLIEIGRMPGLKVPSAPRQPTFFIAEHLGKMLQGMIKAKARG